MNNNHSAGLSAESGKLVLPPINRNNNSAGNDRSVPNLLEEIEPMVEGDEEDLSSQRPRAFKFGQVDQKLLVSRLYSTPFNKASSHQKYVLDMGTTTLNKPHIRKLEQPPAPLEPVVRTFILRFCTPSDQVAKKRSGHCVFSIDYNITSS